MIINLQRISFAPQVIALVFTLSILSNCASKPTFRIFDAETKEPIEGAVALATWIGTDGLPGLTHSYIKKAVEAVSDENGILKMPPHPYAFSNPRLKIYKAGYVGWDSLRIYVGCYSQNKKLAKTISRENFVMKDQNIFLEPWRDEYTFISHGSFIAPTGNLSRRAGLYNSKYREAIEYEVPFRVKERNKDD